MAYNPIQWEDSPSQATPINAENLNKMDMQIKANELNIAELDTNKLEAMQDAADAGKVMTVGADGKIVPRTPQTGSTDYEKLDNKPSINSVELVGNKTLAQIGIEANPEEETTESLTSIKVGNIVYKIDNGQGEEQLIVKGSQLGLTPAIFTVRSDNSAVYVIGTQDTQNTYRGAVKIDTQNSTVELISDTEEQELIDTYAGTLWQTTDKASSQNVEQTSDGWNYVWNTGYGQYGTVTIKIVGNTISVANSYGTNGSYVISREVEMQISAENVTYGDTNVGDALDGLNNDLQLPVFHLKGTDYANVTSIADFNELVKKQGIYLLYEGNATQRQKLADLGILPNSNTGNGLLRAQSSNYWELEWAEMTANGINLWCSGWRNGVFHSCKRIVTANDIKSNVKPITILIGTNGEPANTNICINGDIAIVHLCGYTRTSSGNEVIANLDFGGKKAAMRIGVRSSEGDDVFYIDANTTALRLTGNAITIPQYITLTIPLVD